MSNDDKTREQLLREVIAERFPTAEEVAREAKQPILPPARRRS